MNLRCVFGRSTKNGGHRALVLFLSFSVLGPVTACTSRESATLGKTVLSINGHDVSTKDFADRLALKLKGFDALSAKDESTLDRAKEETEQEFLLEFITRDYAKKNNISVPTDEVEKAIVAIKTGYPDDFAFRRALADQNLSIEKWRSDMEFSLLQKKVFAAVVAAAGTDTEPTDAELKTYYDANKIEFSHPARVRLRQVVLSKEDDAKRMMDELTAGASMEHLARKFSIAPESTKGGETTWIEKGTLDIFDQAFKMPIGSRSKILKSPYGWHIFEVLKKEPEARLSFADSKAKIRAHFLEIRQQAAFTKWLEDQVRHATVKRNDAVLRAIKVTTRGS